ARVSTLKDAAELDQRLGTVRKRELGLALRLIEILQARIALGRDVSCRVVFHDRNGLAQHARSPRAGGASPLMRVAMEAAIRDLARLEVLEIELENEVLAPRFILGIIDGETALRPHLRPLILVQVGFEPRHFRTSRLLGEPA